MTTYSINDSALVPDVFEWTADAPTSQEYVSETTGATQIAVLAGDRWRCRLQWPRMIGAPARQLLAILNALVDREHTVEIPASWGFSATGDLSGTPVVDGAGQTGKSLAIRGAGLSKSPWIGRAGMFQVGTQLFMATADANSDGTGDVTVAMRPSIRSGFADGTAVEVDDPVGLFRMVRGGFTVLPTATINGKMYDIGAQFEEAL